MSDPGRVFEMVIKKWRQLAMESWHHTVMTAYQTCVADLEAALQGSASSQTDGWVEQRLRSEWWLGHGCTFAALYGDDGEMQCNALTCHKDFKRDSLEHLRKHVDARRLALAASALSPRTTDAPTEEK